MQSLDQISAFDSESCWPHLVFASALPQSRGVYHAEVCLGDSPGLKYTAENFQFNGYLFSLISWVICEIKYLLGWF